LIVINDFWAGISDRRKECQTNRLVPIRYREPLLVIAPEQGATHSDMAPWRRGSIMKEWR